LNFNPCSEQESFVESADYLSNLFLRSTLDYSKLDALS